MRSRQEAFTLVELMAATAIAAMVMVAVMGVLVNLTRAETAQKLSGREKSLESRLRDVFTMDLAHADRCRLAKAGFSIGTNASLDAKSMEFSHRPSTVTYEVRKVGTRCWLVRVQKGSAQPTAELVCPGVKSVTLEPKSDVTNDWKAMPARSTVEVAFEEERRPAMQFVFSKALPP